MEMWLWKCSWVLNIIICDVYSKTKGNIIKAGWHFMLVKHPAKSSCQEKVTAATKDIMAEFVIYFFLSQTRKMMR